MQTLFQDLRFAARLLWRSPGFTFVALASLTLGIGANTAIFSLVNAVVLRPMPVSQPETLVSLFQTDERNPGNLPVSHLNYKDIRQQTSTFADVAGMAIAQVNYQAGTGQALELPVQVVSGNYFDLLGSPIALGRGFGPDEDNAPGAHPVTVLSWGFWQQRLGGDANVLGRTLVFNRVPFTVVGVASRTFTGTLAFAVPSVWVPMSMHLVAQPELTWYEQRRGLFLFPVARLKPGVTIDQARENVTTVMASLANQFPKDNAGRSATVLPLVEARVDPNGQGQLRNLSTLMLAVVGIVLLIACANLANLLLGRSAKRRRELAVRLAIGASRARLLRQLLTETVLLATLGGAAGLVFANWCIAAMAATPGLLPIPIGDGGIGLDPRVLAFTMGISMLTGVIVGLAPALDASRTDVIGAIKQETLPQAEGRGRLRKSLVAAQVALSVISLVAAGLLLRSLRETTRIQPGFATTSVATLDLNLGREGYDQTRALAFYRLLLERSREVPGVKAAALAQTVPLGGTVFARSVFLDTQDTSSRDRRLVAVNDVSPSYFAATEIPLLRGREFDDRDTATSPQVAVINETMAAQFWPNEDALGKRFRFFGDDMTTEVVGIARDSKVNGLAEQPAPLVYEPLFQDYSPVASLLVRVDGSGARIAPDLRGVVAALDPGVAVLGVRTLEQQVAQSITDQRTLTAAVGIFGGVALLLAALGLYGVASFWVGQRTREIGVRMALGAEPRRMIALVLRQALVIVAVGAGLGLGLALLLAMAVGAQADQLLVHVRPTDPITFASTLAVLVGVALLACLLPARRAARIDPLKALKQD